MEWTRNELISYKKFYDNLPDDVEYVYNSLTQRENHIEIIRKALSVIKKYEAQEYVGLFLIHRHFDCPEKSVFIERTYTPNPTHSTVLVTQAEIVDGKRRLVAPHRLAIGKAANIVPLEFTTDRTACDGYRSFAADEGLQRELSDTIVSEGYDSLLGISIYPRAGALKTATSVYLEETIFRDRRSVVHILPRLPAEIGVTIPTLWIYGENAAGCCAGQCVSYCSHGPAGYCGHRNTAGHMVCV